MEYINWIDLIEKELKGKLKVIISKVDEKTKVLLEEFFGNIGLEIKFVNNLEEVAEIILQDPLYQIVIFSLSEKNKDFSVFIEKLRNISSYVKIFIIIDYSEEEDLGDYFETGADEVILKPFTLNEFKARLFKLLKEHYLDIKLQKFIVEDPLTQVYNRRYFDETIKEEIYKALRQKYPLSLIMIDLDNFKWYNDNFGHQEGDKLLKSFGEILWKNVRDKIDKVCRYGGDEFVIILPYTFWKNASLIAERICKAWEEKKFSPVTLSIGIAQLIERESLEKSISDLINRADKAMYSAKKLEKNMWIIDKESFKQFLNEGFQDEGGPFQSLP
uniref:diguanylate cyclase n=1 Tax=Thermodesulfobacterium geofontis TaxID=1295609 RepID=A0A7V4JQ24_9BACT